MKEAIDLIPVQQSVDEENFANRKLIRPALPRTDHNHGNHNSNHNSSHMLNGDRRERHGNERHERQERPERAFDRGDRGSGGGRKPAPPEQTNAENFYYTKQMQSRTPMVIMLQDGEQVHGVIEWYDKNCIKIIRNDGKPNLMIYKPAIKYMYKEDEGR